MTPDKTNTPDPVKLVDDFELAVRTEQLTKEYRGSAVNETDREALSIAKAALLAEFTRLAREWDAANDRTNGYYGKLESWNQIWGPVLDFAQRNSAALGIKLGASIADWVLETMKERATPTEAPGTAPKGGV